MSSAPLILNQAVTATPPAAGEGAGPVNAAHTADITNDKQGDSGSFPLIMQQIAPNEKGQVTDSLLTAGLTVDPKLASAKGSTKGSTKEADATLPPAGIILPFIVSQNLAADRAQLGAKPGTASTAESAVGKGIDVAAAASYGATKQARDKLAASLPQANSGADAGKSNALTPETDAPSHFAQLANGVISGAPQTHSTLQSLINDISAISNQHNTAGATDHAGVDTGNSNIANNPLMQSGDKMVSNTAAAAIAVPLRHPEWSDELSNRVTWMIKQDVQSASVKINPPHLGPLEVKVSIANDQVNVSFTSHHAPVREALDASIPRLREMLGDNGLQLGDANVSHHSFSDQSQANQQSFSQSNHADGGYGFNSSEAPVEDLKPDPVYFSSSAAIDIYA